MKRHIYKRIRILAVWATSMAILLTLAVPSITLAITPCGDKNKGAYTPSIDIGCTGQGDPIADALFAIIRILSDGVGLVVIASIIWAGIQYAASQGNPQNSAQAVNRIRNSVLALLIYIFGYAILNYIIPKGFLH